MRRDPNVSRWETNEGKTLAETWDELHRWHAGDVVSSVVPDRGGWTWRVRWGDKSWAGWHPLRADALMAADAVWCMLGAVTEEGPPLLPGVRWWCALYVPTEGQGGPDGTTVDRGGEADAGGGPEGVAGALVDDGGGTRGVAAGPVADSGRGGAALRTARAGGREDVPSARVEGAPRVDRPGVAPSDGRPSPGALSCGREAERRRQVDEVEADLLALAVLRHRHLVDELDAVVSRLDPDPARVRALVARVVASASAVQHVERATRRHLRRDPGGQLRLFYGPQEAEEPSGRSQSALEAWVFAPSGPGPDDGEGR